MRKLTKEERAARWWRGYGESPLSREYFAIEQQDARELPLVEALRKVRDRDTEFPASALCAVKHIAACALAAYDALDAAPEPTLLEAAKAVIENNKTPFAAFDALRAAVERAEREAK